MNLPFAAARLAIGGFFKQLPGWLWFAMLAGLAIAAGIRAHANAVQATFDRGYAAGVLANEQAHAVAQAKEQARAEGINSKLRTKNDEENHRIDDAAADLQLRGPGKAACPRIGAPAAAARGHVEASGSADAPVADVPDPERAELIAVPFSVLIDFAQQHDRLRAAELTRRESERQLSQPQE